MAAYLAVRPSGKPDTTQWTLRVLPASSIFVVAVVKIAAESVAGLAAERNKMVSTYSYYVQY